MPFLQQRRIELALPWLARAAWVGLGVAIAVALDGATATTTIVCWATWGAGAVAAVVLAPIGLTILRMIAPLAIVGGALGIAIGESQTGRTAAVIVTGVVATVIMFSAEIGRSFVEASAYGDEQRFPLRPPAPMMPPMVLAWMLWAAGLATATVLLDRRRWFAGVAVLVAAVVLTTLIGRRLHRLSLRWLVLVPAGLVIHDGVVLAETLMVPKANVAGVRLAAADTQAADLTGPAAGHAIEVSTGAMIDVVLAPTRTQPRGRALHAGAMLVAPTRPGQALAAAGEGGLPVG